ncbi:MAG: LuxR C-terminal-related transcriptional regulator [Xanthobacteraceae bacterium]
MDETIELSALTGDIYDAALDPTLWPDVLGRTKRFVGGLAASLAWKDAVTKRGDSYYDDGDLDPAYRQLYFEKYIKLDPCTTGQFFAELGEPVCTTDVIPYDEFKQTRFYQEWVRPQKLTDFAATMLDKTVTSVAFLGVFRHERHGLFDDEARRRIRLLVPHFRRALLIGNLIDLKTAEAATLADTLDGIGAGMFLVDAGGRIVHANAAGHALLKAAGVLHAENGRLAANDPNADRTFADAFAMSGDGDGAIGAKAVAVPLAAPDGDRYVAHVLPLTSGARRRAGTSYSAAAALFVRRAALDAPSPPEVIARTFRLTPMELRVLLAVVEVGGVPEVAVALGIAETTVKTHLGRTYQKTGTARQAELVKLVAGFSNPLAP